MHGNGRNSIISNFTQCAENNVEKAPQNRNVPSTLIGDNKLLPLYSKQFYYFRDNVRQLVATTINIKFQTKSRTMPILHYYFIVALLQANVQTMGCTDDELISHYFVQYLTIYAFNRKRM
jgi:hypothetical protein